MDHAGHQRQVLPEYQGLFSWPPQRYSGWRRHNPGFGVLHHLGSGQSGYFRGIIGAAIINDNDFIDILSGIEHHSADIVSLIIRRHSGNNFKFRGFRSLYYPSIISLDSRFFKEFFQFPAGQSGRVTSPVLPALYCGEADTHFSGQVLLCPFLFLLSSLTFSLSSFIITSIRYCKQGLTLIITCKYKLYDENGLMSIYCHYYCIIVIIYGRSGNNTGQLNKRP